MCLNKRLLLLYNAALEIISIMSGFSTNESLVFEKKLDIVLDNRQCQSLTKVYELEDCKQWIEENRFQRVCLQFPDKMLCDATAVSNYLKKETSAQIFILADTSYGSCCVDCIAAQHVAADSIIHFGPSCVSPHSGIPVLYVYEAGELDLENLVKAVAEIIDVNKTLVIFYDSQFHHYSSQLEDAFSGLDRISIASLKKCHSPDDNVMNVSGRTFKIADPKLMQGLFIGPDSMTLTNLVLRLPDVNWFRYNKGELRTYDFNTSKFLMKRLHLVEKLKDAQAVGIVVATLAVESYLSAVDRVKELCKLSGKRCYTLAVGRPNVAKLANFPEIDVFVLVSCPENVLLVENSDFYKPLVSLFEVELALGGRPWDSRYSFDFRQVLPEGDLFVNSELTDDERDADISLVTGRVRNLAAKNSSSENIDPVSGTVSIRDPGIVATSHAAEFLSNRSWSGLEQRIGETPVEETKQGRRGVPGGYEDEGQL